MNDKSIEYNTQRSKLLLPEYGRCIQSMIDHAKTIDDRSERLRCARTIIGLMSKLHEQTGDQEEFMQKLWNHLAAMSNYELDIDYPVEIEHHDDSASKRESIPYPQKRIAQRHYGALLESLTKKIGDIEDNKEREALTILVANQMKRSLANWNKDAMNDKKVVDDLARYTNGEVVLNPEEGLLISNAEVLNQNTATGGKKKKKK